MLFVWFKIVRIVYPIYSCQKCVTLISINCRYSNKVFRFTKIYIFWWKHNCPPNTYLPAKTYHLQPPFYCQQNRVKLYKRIVSFITNNFSYKHQYVFVQIVILLTWNLLLKLEQNNKNIVTGLFLDLSNNFVFTIHH